MNKLSESNNMKSQDNSKTIYYNTLHITMKQESILRSRQYANQIP